MRKESGEWRGEYEEEEEAKEDKRDVDEDGL